MARSYTYKVVYPIPEILTEAGYGKVAHVPFILDSKLQYHVVGSRFLQDRALGIWDPKNRGASHRAYPPTSKSVRSFANSIANFLEWCDVRDVDPMKAEYARDLIGRYQTEMIKGIWSATGTGLAAQTINLRVSHAIDLLTWAADKGMREPLDVPRVTKIIRGHGAAHSSVAHLGKEVAVRQGKLRVSKRHLGFPSEQEVGEWLHRLYSKPVVGPTEGLLCETILETALREAEVAGLRVDTLPLNPSEWKVASRDVALKHQMVIVDIRFGTKGPEYGWDAGDKIGPVGTIRVPMNLALKLHEYRNTGRSKALAVAIKKGKTVSEQRKIRAEAVHLFLNPKTGQRYTPSRVYDAWRSVDLPRKGWHPHLGRDFWACTTLWMRMETHRQLLEHSLKRKLDESVVAAVRSNALSVIELEIQPQLRHVSKETTMVYLQWLGDRLGVSLDVHENYVESLSTEGEEECT